MTELQTYLKQLDRLWLNQLITQWLLPILKLVS